MTSPEPLREGDIILYVAEGTRAMREYRVCTNRRTGELEGRFIASQGHLPPLEPWPAPPREIKWRRIVLRDPTRLPV